MGFFTWFQALAHHGAHFRWAFLRLEFNWATTHFSKWIKWNQACEKESMWVIKDSGFRGDSSSFSSKVGASLACVTGIWPKATCAYNWRKRLFLHMRWGITSSIPLGKILCTERIGTTLEMEPWDHKPWRWRDEWGYGEVATHHHHHLGQMWLDALMANPKSYFVF